MALLRIIYSSKKSKARLGEIKTPHGIIKTPAFVPVATKGTIKTLSPEFIKKIGIQVAFVNTYHLVNSPGVETIEKVGGIHKLSNLNIPLMSDSGGFQVFSLAKNSKHRHRVFSTTSLPKGGSPRRLSQKQVSSTFKQEARKAKIRGEEEPLVLKISENGVKFRSPHDGRIIEFTPEKTIKYQMGIGADLMMAFDECTYYPSTHQYAEGAMERTHKWLIRCIDYFCKSVSDSSSFATELVACASQTSSRLTHPNSLPYNKQFLYGIIQGATFKDLRKQSAEFVVSQPVDGVAIGGVSVGESKKEMRDQIKWTVDYLPKDRSVHLLGVGQFDDILDLVSYGIDSFDCVEPTRLARTGKVFCWSLIIKYLRRRKFLSRVNSKILSPSDSFEIDILKTVFKKDLSPVDENCRCYVCQNFTKAYLHHLFKQKEILAYSLATYHNLWVMERFMEKIREMISHDKI